MLNLFKFTLSFKVYVGLNCCIVLWRTLCPFCIYGVIKKYVLNFVRLWLFNWVHLFESSCTFECRYTWTFPALRIGCAWGRTRLLGALPFAPNRLVIFLMVFKTFFMYKFVYFCTCILTLEHAVAHLVEALGYKPGGRGFRSRLCHWNFSLTWSFRPNCGAGVGSAYNRNECQEYFVGSKGGRCVRMTTLPLICAVCL